MNERDIFEKAIEIQDRKQRDAFLEQACGADAALRKRLDELLASHDQASGFLKVPVVDQAPPTKLTGPHPTLELLPTEQSPGHETADAANDDDHDDEAAGTTDLSFLQPSSKAGSIGRLGHYEILQVLGQGAFGIVFKAFDEKLHRHVAIKAMNPQLASTSPPRKRFLREARSVAAIKHENIVQVYAVEEQPLPYLAMEFVDGQTLAQKLETAGPLEAPEILHLGRQMAAGLAAAHEKGLIHRDIKPGNILIEAGAEQKVKITDFGLARAADDATMTRTGTIAGTPMFMSPEQAMGQTLDHRSDLFSLGGVLYQMACGRPPFRGANAIAVLKRVVDEAPRPIRDVLPDVPEWLCAIIEKLHAKSPDERYQTAKEVADLLARCQNELQVTGKVTCVPVRGQSANKAAKTPTTVEAPVVAPSQRSAVPSSNRSLVAVAAVALLAIGGVTITEFTGITSFVRKPNSEPGPVASGESSGDTATTKVQMTKAAGWGGWPADAPQPAIAPFDAEQAKKHQEEWAKYLNVPVEYTNSIGMTFRLIPPGEFMMGSTPEEAEIVAEQNTADQNWPSWVRSSAPEHRVRLTQAWYLGTYEVTQEQYEMVMGTNPSSFSSTGAYKDKVSGQDAKHHPVEMVSFSDAVEYCIKLDKQENLKPVYFSAGGVITLIPGDGYRLPAEAEWEYACRAGTNTGWLDDAQRSTLGTLAWFNGNSGGLTHPVGQLKSNGFGLYDMQGNVSEWCQDWYDAKAFAQRGASVTVNPRGPEAGTARVLRGGDWYNSASASRPAFRFSNESTLRFYAMGFRLSLSVDAVRQALGVTGPALPKSASGLGGNEVAAKATTPGTTSSTTTPTKPSAEAASERELAAWLLTKPGMSLILVTADGSASNEVRTNGTLPTVDFTVSNIVWNEAGEVTDEDLTRIGRAQRLYALTLGDDRDRPINATGKGFDALFSPTVSRSLRLLTLSATMPMLAHEDYLKINRANDLNKLSFANIKVPDFGRTLAALRLSALQQLGVAPSDFDGGFMTALSENSPDLVGLQIHGVQLTPEDVSAVKRFDLLEDLILASGGITDAGLMDLGSLPRLKRLDLSRNRAITDAGGKFISTGKSLVHLNLSDTNVTDAVCDTLAGLPALEQLSIRNSRLSDKGLERLAALPKLSELDVRGCKRLTDEGLSTIAKMTALKQLYIQTNPQLTEAAVRKLRIALPKCEIVSDFPNDPDLDVALWALSLPGERFVGIAVGDEIRTVKTIEELPPGRFDVVGIGFQGELAPDRFTDTELIKLGSLKRLGGIGFYAGPFPAITDQGMETFCRLASVEHFEQFRLDVSSITDASIPHLNRLSSLRGLALNHPQFTDAGLRQLKLPKLLDLAVNHASELTPAGFEGLASQCPAIATIDIQGMARGDADLTPLRQWRLGILNLAHTSVSAKGLQAVGQITSLSQLQLNSNLSVTDEGVGYLSNLTSLHNLHLGDTSVTDGGLDSLAKLTQLQDLWLNGCDITDAGLETLKVLHSLQRLDVRRCPKISAAGVHKLQSALPNCQIVSDFSQFDFLDPTAIPAEERIDGQPPELVGLIGSHRATGHAGVGKTMFSPDGRWLVRMTYLGSLHIWEAETLRLVYHQAPVYSDPVFSGDGRTMAIGASGGNSGTVELFDMTQDKPRRIARQPVPESNGVHGAALLPGGKAIASGGGAGDLRIYDLGSPEDKPRMILREFAKSNSASSYNLMVKPDGQRLGAICAEPFETKPGEVAIRFWEISGQQPQELFQIPFKLTKGSLYAVLSPDGNFLFVANDAMNWLEVYDVSGTMPKRLDRVELPENVFRLPGFIKDQVSFRVATETNLQLWQLVDGKLKKTRDFPPGTIAVNDDLSRYVVRKGAQDHGSSMDLFDAEGNRLVEGSIPAVVTIGERAIPLIGNTSVSTTTPPNRRWEVREGRWQAVEEVGWPVADRQNWRLSPNEQLVAVMNSWTVEVFPADQLWAEKPVRSSFISSDEKNPISGWSLRWAPDSRSLFSMRQDGTIEQWDITQSPATSQLVLMADGAPRSNGFPHEFTMEISPTVRYLAWTANKGGWRGRLLDLTTKQVTQLPLPPEGFGANAVRFHPDGKHLLARDVYKGTLWRYRIDDPAAAPELVLTPPIPDAIAFEVSPDGRLLVTSDGRTLRWYDATVPEAILLGESPMFANSTHFRIAPDSRHVLLEQAGTIYVLRLVSGPAKRPAEAKAEPPR